MLGSAGGGGADGVPADDPVTSLDMCVASDCLLAGHGSGRILLWDYLRWGQGVQTNARRRTDGKRVNYSVLAYPGTRMITLPHPVVWIVLRKHAQLVQIVKISSLENLYR